MTTRIKLRRDTAANWTSNDPVLALGEAGYDTTNNELRVGDGTTAWSGLEAIGGGISSNVAIAPEFGPAVTFGRPEDVATDAVNAVDVIDTGVALGRDNDRGGLLNVLEDDLTGYNSGSYDGEPTHTEWNTEGWDNLDNVTTRTYQNFFNMKQSLNNNDLVGVEIIMHDTLNDKYYTFKFDRWSVGDNGGDGGFGYVRRLINHTQYFTKTNYGNELDSIDTGLVITRGNNGGIYNDESEGDHNSDVSPQGTEWNIDGWSDLSNLLTRTYTNFTSAFSYQVGQRILGKEAIMHDTINDKYYAVKFLQWTQNNNGGGFTWQRRLIDTTQLDEGLHFADGTVQTTAGITFNSDGSLELPGGLVLPYQSTTGYRIGYTLTGPTLRLSNDSQNQVIVTGPAATENNSYAQRIVIQGQRGYGSTSTQGEGGDVYIWGGIGGETNGNSNGWSPGGGSGGDVKLRGGEGLNDDGGYVRIEGGNVAHFSTSTTGDAGFVEITGGDVSDDNTAVSSRGGDIRITGGRAYSATTQSGVVQVITGGISNGDVVGANTWTFSNSGTLTLPEGGAFTSPNYGFSFNKNSGKTGAPELGTDVTFATESLDSDILDGQVYMGSGYGEFRSIYNKVDSTESGLVYAGVEGFNYVQYGDVNFAGMVSQTPNIDSMYALSLNEQGQIVIGFTQNGQTQTSTDWSVTVGTLNTDMTVNGLFANTTTTVIGSGLSSWTFSNSGTLTFPVLTIATLPSATPAGQRAFISDGESSLAWGVTVGSTGTTTYPVWSDGSNWKIG